MLVTAAVLVHTDELNLNSPPEPLTSVPPNALTVVYLFVFV